MTKSPWSLVRRPLFVLGVLLVASTASRAAWISVPETVASDERFYVSAGRHIAQLPLNGEDTYSTDPLGLDPNSEHPPLGKLLIGASMRVLGDKPLGWRLPSVVFGTLAVAAMYWLARSAGASQWEALGAAALMAADNMYLAYGRFATLDIFVVVFMMVGVCLYLRRRPWLAGLVLGIGACTKVVGLSALAVVAVIELFRRAQRRRGLTSDTGVGGRAQGTAMSRLPACLLVTALTYLVVLGALDRTITDFPDPVAHTRQMLSYAEITTFQLEAQVRGTLAQGPLAPATRPWRWFVNDGVIGLYHKAAAPEGEPGSNRTLVRYEARTSPVTLWLAMPALLFLAYRAWAYGDEVSNLGVAWTGATMLALIAVTLRERVSYIYYFVMVLPGIYLAIARLLSRRRLPWVVPVACVALVVAGAVASYPFRTWGGQ